MIYFQARLKPSISDREIESLRGVVENGTISVRCHQKEDTNLDFLCGQILPQTFSFNLSIRPLSETSKEGYFVAYFLISREGIRRILFEAQTGILFRKISAKDFFSFFVHYSGAVEISHFRFHPEKMTFSVRQIRPRSLLSRHLDLAIKDLSRYFSTPTAKSLALYIHHVKKQINDAVTLFDHHERVEKIDEEFSLGDIKF